MHTVTTQEIIEELTNTLYGHTGNVHQKYIFEQTLYNLVRLAKTEQMLEIKSSVKKLSGTFALDEPVLKSKVVPRD